MSRWLLKLGKDKNQYRVTLPRDLIEEAALENYRILVLSCSGPHTILIEGYNGETFGRGINKGNRNKPD